MKTPEISVVLPCLNEEKAIGFCIDKIKQAIKGKLWLRQEILLMCFPTI